MDETQRQEFRWYIMGSRNVGHEPGLDRNEFLAHYGRYKRCSQAIQRYEERKRRLLRRRRGAAYKDDVFLERLMAVVREEQKKLTPLAAAVAIGQALDMDDGGAGVSAHRLPDTPVLVGAGAKLLPHLDPEPWMRDP
jgi:hypothetical protein